MAGAYLWNIVRQQFLSSFLVPCLVPKVQFLLLEVGKRHHHQNSSKSTNYQLPNGPVKAGRRWGQRHPQGANLGSNGILKFLYKIRTTAATSPP